VGSRTGIQSCTTLFVLGLAVALTSVVMLFVAFTSAYIVRQGYDFDPSTNSVVHDWIPVRLPTLLFLINTCVLLLSSVTIERARRQLARKVALEPVQSIREYPWVRKENFPGLALTIVLDCVFSPANGWPGAIWRREGSTSPRAPAVPSCICSPARTPCICLGGILALLAAGVSVALNRPLASRRIVVDVTAWYWHFMALLWIYILALLEFCTLARPY